jgi:hypothetical protein
MKVVASSHNTLSQSYFQLLSEQATAAPAGDFEGL